MDKLLKAISETLGKLGLDEETVSAAAEEIVAKVGEEESPKEEEVNPPVEPNEGEVPPSDESASAEPEGEVPPSEPAPSDDVPPVEEVADPVPPTEEVVPPTEPEVPPVPPFDPTELLGKIDELSKANEGLMARIQSLEDALKQAGIVDSSSSTAVGDETPNVPGEPSDEDVLTKQLNFLNRKPQI